MTPAQVRTNYSNLRDVAMKRIGRMLQHGYGNYDVANAARFPKVKGQSEAELRANLAEISRFLNDPRSTIKGLQREETTMREALRRASYDIPNDKIKEFGEFMEYIRERYKNRVLPPSHDAASLFEASVKKNISVATLKREFGKYLKDSSMLSKLAITIDQIEKDPGRKRVTSTEVKRLYGETWND